MLQTLGDEELVAAHNGMVVNHAIIESGRTAKRDRVRDDDSSDLPEQSSIQRTRSTLTKPTQQPVVDNFDGSIKVSLTGYVFLRTCDNRTRERAHLAGTASSVCFKCLNRNSRTESK